MLDKKNKGTVQTTKGVWISTSTEHKMLLFDIEGSGSSERMDEGFVRENLSFLHDSNSVERRT